MAADVWTGHCEPMTENEARERLIARREELREEIRMTAESRAPVTLQQDAVGRLSRMDAIQQQQMAEAKQRRREAEIGRIGAALSRLDEGEWGWCISCGEEIQAARLEHDPSLPTCVSCAKGESR